MNKLFISILLSSSISFASLINAIALVVNDKAITLYDIEKTMYVNNIDRNEAIGLLIDKVLYEQLVKQNNITADIFDVNDYIEKLARANGMDIYSFKSIINQKYSDYSIFENEAKNIVIRQKLIQKLIKGNLNIANEEDMQIYYEKNKDKFLATKTYEVIEYSSKNRNSLLQTIKSPLIISSDVQRNTITLETKELNPQLQYVLEETNLNNFTPIFTGNKEFKTLFIVKKSGQVSLDFQVVKPKVFNEIMSIREKKYLKDYFEKQKLTADIKIVR